MSHFPNCVCFFLSYCCVYLKRVRLRLFYLFPHENWMECWGLPDGCLVPRLGKPHLATLYVPCVPPPWSSWWLSADSSRCTRVCLLLVSSKSDTSIQVLSYQCWKLEWGEITSPACLVTPANRTWYLVSLLHFPGVHFGYSTASIRSPRSISASLCPLHAQPVLCVTSSQEQLFSFT